MARSKEERLKALLEKFRAVAPERLEKMNAAWLTLERTPDAPEAAAELLREIHTLKGEARAVGLAEANAVAHRTEDVLQLVARAGWRVGSETFSAVLGAFDLLERIIRGDEGAAASLSATVDRLDAALTGLSPGASAPAPAAAPSSPAPARPSAPEPEAVAGAAMRVETLRVPASRVGQLSESMAQVLVQGRALRRELEGLTADAVGVPAAWAAVRRRVSRLAEVEHQLDLLFREVESSVRGLRLVPVSVLFSGVPRLVRDVALQVGKAVTLQVEGEDVEADKRVVEDLREPLLHLVRNAVDHGIEPARAREAAGKPAVGVVRLKASTQGGELVVSVSDDGAGLDPDGLRASAIKKGLLSAEAASRLDDAQARQLVFLSGFSTRAEVTDLSGRGVGLDVVRASVERLGGRVRLGGERGKGVDVELAVPLSVTLTPCLVVTLGGHRCALPSVTVDRVLPWDERRVQQTPRGLVVQVGDGDFLPASELATLLALPSPPGEGDRLLVLQSGPERFALRTPDAGREAELLVRPPGPPLRRHPLLAGLAATDEGAPVLLLSVAGLLERTRLGLSPKRERGARERRQRVLLVVEDSPIYQELVTALLGGLGHDVRLARDGQEAVELLGQQVVDAVLSDIQMPRMDGLALLRWIRGSEKLKTLPVVLLSALGSAEDKRRGLEAGADGYLVKADLSEQALASAIERVLG